jgi:uncharacterized protein with HEPN domain
MKSERLYLVDILRSIQKIENSAAVGETAFLVNEEKQDATIRNFEIIGEAIKRLSVATREKRPEVDWKGFMGFRDVLIHQYDKVAVEEVWVTINHDLPILKLAILYLLENSAR